MESRVAIVRSELLVLRHRSGDAAALPELVELWERPLLYYLRRLLESEPDAWDALQETWLRVVRDLPRLRDERAFPSWLYTIARNAAFSARRRTRPTEPLPEEESDRELPAGAPEPSLDGWDAMDIHAALARLSLAHRDALTLHFLEGFSIAEIGAITGAAQGTIKSRLYHAKRAMRLLLEGGQS
jgi:RNA polymerase sigma-70 factor (ECF subfamily)